MDRHNQNDNKAKVDISTLLAATSGGALLIGSFLGIGGAALGSILGAGFSVWANHITGHKQNQTPASKHEGHKAVLH